MPHYLLSVWHDEPYDDLDFSSPDMQRLGAQVGAFNASLEKAGAWVFGTGLRPASSATVVRATGTRRLDDRRSLRRDQRADGRVLDHRSRRPRRRPGLGRQGRGGL